MAKGKLHELLAVEADLKAIYIKVLEETKATFTKRHDHFKEHVRTLEMFDENAPAAPEERKAMDDTVMSKLRYQTNHVIRFMDAALQKEATNQTASAAITIDDTVIAENVPAGFLLALERFLKQIREVYSTIPTLPPGIEWEQDTNRGADVYKRTYPEEQFKTEKVFVPQILYEATKEHPAQVEKISETRNVGKYTRREWCSMLTPAEKSNLLTKIDQLIYATKKARQRANSVEVDKRTIGIALFNYIHK
jgi:hypothetical protein